MLASRRPPWYLVLPAVGSALAVALPLLYLCYRAFTVEPDAAPDPIFAVSNLRLLGNTLLLMVGVLTVVTLLALPAAWLVVRTDLVGRRLFTLLLVLPLAVPGYVMAYAWIGQGGYDGLWTEWLGRKGDPISVPKGYVGSLIALSLYNFPYMFLNLRAAMLELDPSLEEAAKSLGDKRSAVLWRVILPQLRPAFFAGAMLVSLHVLADFGVVSLMRYDTLTYRLYMSIDFQDPTGMARVALLLLMAAGVLVAIEMWFLRGLRLERAGVGARRGRQLRKLGRASIFAHAYLLTIFMSGVVMPVIVVIFWMRRVSMNAIWPRLGEELKWSLIYSAAPALCATLVAIPIGMLRARYPSRASFIYERLPYIGYAIPALAFALSLIYIFRNSEYYATFWFRFLLLVFALSIHFLAESVGPVRSGFYLAPPRMEEASRSLGIGRLRTFFRVTLPTIRNALIVSMALIFISCMKELPLTMLLSPVGTRTLAVAVWAESEDAEFAAAAPRALAILIFSGVFVSLLLLRDRKRS